jgi:hypothetical protein
MGAIEQQMSNLHTIRQGENARIQEEVKKYAETATFSTHQPVSSTMSWLRLGGRILRRISDSPHREILAKYAGCYNPRPMRGGNRPSKHSWGAAIDLDPDHNGLKTSWPVAATMPIEVMEEFAREGWIGLGWQIGRDSMHFQPTR